ncbi:MAG: winged helix-turn-helix domain-containing protein, partial [Thermoplasmatota archaeon]
KKELEQQQREQGTAPMALSKIDRDHYGDHDYWTARRLYVLRWTTGLSYREIAKQTGIPKSTVQRRVKEHREASTS